MSNPALYGPLLTPSGVTFRLWAPAAKSVELVLARVHPMQPRSDGWYTLTIEGTAAGTLYRFRIDGELEIPDPASHFQPQDVFGPSQVVDHDAYDWQVRDWGGRPWQDAAFLELHIGTFTAGGTFRSALERLDHVTETGLTAIELMPVADFVGDRNWGYDGMLLYAPDSAYGRPEDLKALVDAAHARGLMVFLDVVYNHFGPEGNYLSRYAPSFFTSAHTPWGLAIDYRVPQVRAFAIENALHWLRHYRFDGLRLDAVHAIAERGEPDLLDELSRAAGKLATETGRTVHLVLENDDNNAHLLDPRTDPPRGCYRAQWNDDYHHAWHVLLTGETHGYYGDYAQEPLDRIVRALSSGFAYQGEPSAHRDGKPRGEPSAGLPPTAFVDFLQNHDQIGNRALGDRLESQVGVPAMEAALAVMLLAPQPPLMFMGEEWGSLRPFPFFCDFKGALADAVREGRREEFKSAYQKLGDDIPDPLDERTFRSATLDWEECGRAAGRRRLGLVRELFTLRHDRVVPLLADLGFDGGTCRGTVITAAWRTPDGRRLLLLANLSDAAAPRRADHRGGAPLWGGEPAATLPPWSVFWSLAAPGRRPP